MAAHSGADGIDELTWWGESPREPAKFSKTSPDAEGNFLNEIFPETVLQPIQDFPCGGNGRFPKATRCCPRSQKAFLCADCAAARAP
jgi:hypothetical protein